MRWIRRAPEGIAAGGPAEPRLGVLSGTFNPPTRGHLAVAERALEALRLDEVLFVLPETPPHKKKLEAPLEDRIEMLRRAVADSPRFSAAVSTHGLFLDIHRALAPHYPARVRVFFLAGRDAAERILLHWPYSDPARALAEMFARFEFGVARRGGPFVAPPRSLAARYAAKIHSILVPPECEKLSATLARKRLARGEPVQDVLPKEVAAYILARGLYRRASR